MFKELCDAIAGDLEDNADLPEHDTQLYQRPRVVRPEDTPLLVVWVVADSPNLEMGTTVTFDYTVTIGVSWHHQVVEEGVTLVNDDDAAIDGLAVLERIRARIRALSREDANLGVAECHEVLPGVSTPNDIGMATGLVAGYATSVLCRIVET